jgi:hypothetical protein
MKNKQQTEIKCLACHATMDHQEICAVLPPNLRQLYEACTFRKWQQSQPDFRWCSHPGCGSGGLVPPEYSFFQCEHCGNKTCCRHRVPWHRDLSCAEYDARQSQNDVATNSYLQRETKVCPKCQAVSAKKKKGCDHVTCLCGHEYCWRCLADFEPIRKEGNHRHKVGCAHYFAWEGH